MWEQRSLRRFRARLDKVEQAYWDGHTLVVVDHDLARAALAFRPSGVFHDKALLGLGASEVQESRRAFRAFAKSLRVEQETLQRSIWKAVRVWSAPDAFVVAALDCFGVQVLGELYPKLREDVITFVLAGVNRHLRICTNQNRRVINRRFFSRLEGLHGEWRRQSGSFAQVLARLQEEPVERARLIGAALMAVSAPPGMVASWLLWEMGFSADFRSPRDSWQPRNVALEILRLRPPAWNHARTVVQPGALGPYLLFPGDEVLVPVGYIQTSCRWWKSSFTFDPDRWNALDPRQVPYFPFGRGPRSCVGAEAGCQLVEAVWSIALNHPIKVSRPLLIRGRLGPLYGPPDFRVTPTSGHKNVV